MEIFEYLGSSMGQDSFIDKEFIEENNQLLFTLLQELRVWAAKKLFLWERREIRWVFE